MSRPARVPDDLGMAVLDLMGGEFRLWGTQVSSHFTRVALRLSARKPVLSGALSFSQERGRHQVMTGNQRNSVAMVASSRFVISDSCRGS